MNRRLVATMAIAGALACASSRARAQETAYRFEITRVSDSTFVLSTAHHDWIKAREKGIAVDPVRHDALVARFMILKLDTEHGLATAVVTGQTTQITLNHVALITRPAKKWYQQPALYIGALVGGAVGAIVAH